MFSFWLEFKFTNMASKNNSLYFTDCAQQGRAVGISYYHQPIRIDARIEGSTGKYVCIQDFDHFEAVFLQRVAEKLGFDIVAKPEDAPASKTTFVVSISGLSIFP